MSTAPVDVAVAAADEPARPVVLVLGDLCADLIAVGNLDGRFTDAPDSTDELTFRTSLRDRAGGTAFHFACAAAAGPMRPVVIGSVGADDSGQMIRRALVSAGLDRVIFESADRATGRVVLAYDDTGRRLMLAERDSANRYLPDPGPVFDAIAGPSTWSGCREYRSATSPRRPSRLFLSHSTRLAAAVRAYW
jgi:sugar/nucleoside kinase (ribokinase family)